MEEESRPDLELIGMEYSNDILTGYFVKPTDLTYVHIWEVKVDREFIYSDTWREVMLVPIDGYRFRRNITLLRGDEDLNALGFMLPESNKDGTLELNNVQWGALFRIKENLKSHREATVLLLDSDNYCMELALEAVTAYMKALWDLQDILGDC
jgi:hypothetical protein